MQDATDSDLVTFLGRYAGVPFCSQCLAHEMGMSRERVEQWMESLAGVDVTRERRWCVRCFRHARTVRIHPRIERAG